MKKQKSPAEAEPIATTTGPKRKKSKSVAESAKQSTPEKSEVAPPADQETKKKASRKSKEPPAEQPEDTSPIINSSPQLSKEQKQEIAEKIAGKVDTCPLCGRPMPVSYSCNFEQLLTRAGWHMNFKPRMTFCGECSQSLLDAVNDWYRKTKKTDTYDKIY